jgi:hypothetical protein
VDSNLIRCSMEDCPESIKNNAWAKTRATSPKKGEGWFFSREDPKLIRCPNHLPDWVTTWRAKQRNKK